MPASLEERRRAIAEALRSVMRERPAPSSPPRAAERPEPAPAMKVTSAAPVAIHMHGVEARLDAMSRQLTEVVVRLGCVQETLATVTSRPGEPADEQQPSTVDDEPYGDDDRVSVPAVALDEVRMSSTAAEALFGG